MVCLNGVCELRYKAYLLAVIHKQMLVFQRLSPYSSEPFETCMSSFVPEVMKSLQQSDQKETLTGAISLCEKIFEVLERSAFEQIFP